VDRYKGLVFSLARHSVGSADEAEDIAQETFIRAYSRLRHFRGEGNFRNWLCRIATRLCLDHHRARRPTESLDAAGFDPSGDPADSDLRQVVSQAIAELPPPYRIAIVLRHLEDLSYQEMADMLGLPVSTVKTHLLRARRRLRDRLGPALGMDRTRLEER
jgi:RNA polymerase sigma-70 factor (ECF subfamily)